MIYINKYHTDIVTPDTTERTEEVITSLVELWKKSVKASHEFLTETDIENLIPTVRDALKNINHLIIVRSSNEEIGFMGIEESKIEMLFISPEYFGHGLGKQLVKNAINDYGCMFVDVNEQNPKAENFYRRMGFKEFERTELDEQGNPFPIIKMRLYE